MKDVFRREIMRGVSLTCVREYKFKTGCLSMTLLTQLDRRTAAMNAALPSVLRRGTARFPDMESLAAQLDGLYGARIEPFVRKLGEVQCIGFYSDFPDDSFVPGGGQILEKTADLMGEMLLSPATSGGRLRAEYVDGERENLIDDIRAEINDKRIYSVRRMTELMCRGEAYGVSRMGSVADAEKISVATLTKHYRETVASSEIEVFYCGAADYARVEQAVRAALASLPRADAAGGPPVTDVKTEVRGAKPRVFTESLDVTQGKLAVGFRMGEPIMRPNYAAMLVFDALYGGSATSKLFLNVREKLSLCYFASSVVDRHKGVMIVSSGIDFAKYDQALSEILAQLDAVKRGDFEDWELDAARRAVVTAIYAAMDDQAGLESLYLDRVVSGMEATPEELAGLADGITREDVIRVARGIAEDTVYFLKGEDGKVGA